MGSVVVPPIVNERTCHTISVIDDGAAPGAQRSDVGRLWVHVVRAYWSKQAGTLTGVMPHPETTISSMRSCWSRWRGPEVSVDDKAFITFLGWSFETEENSGDLVVCRCGNLLWHPVIVVGALQTCSSLATTHVQSSQIALECVEEDGIAVPVLVYLLGRPIPVVIDICLGRPIGEVHNGSAIGSNLERIGDTWLTGRHLRDEQLLASLVVSTHPCPAVATVHTCVGRFPLITDRRPPVDAFRVAAT